MRQIDRILSLPVSPPLTKAEAAAADSLAVGFSWMPDQRAFLCEVLRSLAVPSDLNGARGAVGAIPCGGGKTLAIQAAATLFRRPLLITPRHLVSGTKAARAEWRGRAAMKMHLATKPDAPLDLDGGTLYTATYGLLSSKKTGAVYLDRLMPDAVFFDEAHTLGAAGRLWRCWDYFRVHRGTRVYVLSGSFMSRSILDFSMPLALALRSGSPLPLDPWILKQWAAVLDAAGEADRDAYAAIDPLCARYLTDDPRAAFRRRFETTPGVVVGTSRLDGVGVSLGMRLLSPRKVQSPAAAAALAQLEETWTTPDGRELVDALEVWAVRQELSLGFYRRWPEGVEDQYEAWFEARREWAKAIRWALGHTPGTPWRMPSEVETAVRTRHRQIRAPTIRAWEAWTAVREAAPPERETVDIDNGESIQNALVGLDPDTVVWYRHRYVGEALERLGFNRQDSPTGGPAAVRLARATGWDGGQRHYHQALVLQVPHTPREMNQLLARLHRAGQSRDVIYTMLGTSKDRARWIEEARQVQRTLPEPQRILIADWRNT